jgi:DNA helicase-2/ATP-dependent DNA helicase PcrA
LYVTHAVKRRVYGEELASEPSQFLNEMPIELIDDLSRGRSWLLFARGSHKLQPPSDSLQYEYDEDSAEYRLAPAPGAQRESARRPAGNYSGKTYNSVDSVAEFFRKRDAQMGVSRGPGPKSQVQSPHGGQSGSDKPTPSAQRSTPADLLPGSYVRHAKYGRGLVLRREGSGDQIKVTVSFPGYGQKKLVEKYAGLEKA